MIIIELVIELKNWLANHRQRGGSIGFVPTMGALHKGHLSLVEASMENNDCTVVSIFVNPKQFNDPQDLENYPRPIENDIRLLNESKVHVLFLPSVKEIYPDDERTSIDFDPGPLATTMEGKFRPGHFQGMAEVVRRLLSIVEPDRLYMGQKDYQQLTIVRKMISDLGLPVLLEMCPTVRESNGLAMSSRNVLLSPEAREKAAIINQTLAIAQQMYEEEEPVSEVKRIALENLDQASVEPEYFDIVDGISLQPVSSMHDSQLVVACCAVRVEGIRLIDNAIWARSE